MTQAVLQQGCRACQEGLVEDKGRAVKFSGKYPQCACDLVSISEYSPNRIENSEWLARLVIEPKHIGNDGTIEVGSLSDIFRNGLSLARCEYVDNKALEKLGSELLVVQQTRENVAAQTKGVAPQIFSCRGAVYFNTKYVRNHVINEKKYFCVMDSADAKDRYHADITVNNDFKKSEQSKIKNELRKVILNLTPQPFAFGILGFRIYGLRSLRVFLYKYWQYFRAILLKALASIDYQS